MGMFDQNEIGQVPTGPTIPELIPGLLRGLLGSFLQNPPGGPASEGPAPDFSSLASMISNSAALNPTGAMPGLEVPSPLGPEPTPTKTEEKKPLDMATIERINKEMGVTTAAPAPTKEQTIAEANAKLKAINEAGGLPVTPEPEKPKKVAPGTRPSYTGLPAGAPAKAAPKSTIETKEEIPNVPTPSWTQPYDLAGEIMRVHGAIPKTIEELAGPRPMVPQKSLLENIFWGAGRGLAGLSPVQEEARAQADLDKQYGQNVAYATKRQEALTNAQIKAAEIKFKMNQMQMEKEEKAWAALGEANPALAKSGTYMAGLYKDLPDNVKQDVITSKIDPKTGLFYEGKSLFMTPEEKMKYQALSYGKILQTYWPDKYRTNEEAAQAGLFFSMNPGEFMKSINDPMKQLEAEIAKLADTRTPKSTADRQRLAELMRIHKELKFNVDQTPAAKAEQSRASLRQEMKSQLANAERQFGKNSERYASEAQAIHRRFATLEDLSDRYWYGGAASVALLGTEEKIGAKENAAEAEYRSHPDYVVGVTINPFVATEAGKGKSGEAFDKIQTARQAVAGAPPGTDIVEYVQRNPMLMDPMTFGKIHTAMFTGLGTHGYNPLINEAATAFGGKTKIPFDNLYWAIYAMKTGQPTEKVRSALLNGATPVATKGSAKTTGPGFNQLTGYSMP